MSKKNETEAPSNDLVRKPTAKKTFNLEKIGFLNKKII